jgi:hypothetical protein
LLADRDDKRARTFLGCLGSPVRMLAKHFLAAERLGAVLCVSGASLVLDLLD